MTTAALLLLALSPTGGEALGMRKLPTLSSTRASLWLSTTSSSSSSSSSPSPGELVASFIRSNSASVDDSNKNHKQQPQQQQQQQQQGKEEVSRQPLTDTILFHIPRSCCVEGEEDVTYLQTTTNTRIRGYDAIYKACMEFDRTFQSDLGVESNIGRISTISDDLAVVNWNVTWVPPTSLWLESLGEMWPGVTNVYTTYNHMSGSVSTFSWKAVGKLFQDALDKGQLRIPLACIEGTTQLKFTTTTTSDDDDDNNNRNNNLKLVSIAEELSYADELRRGVLQNRKCAQDLRLFLETGRRYPQTTTAVNTPSNNGALTSNKKNTYIEVDTELYDEASDDDEWDRTVALCLPWSSVPGSNPLDVDPLEEEEEGFPTSVVFVGIVILISLFFMNAIGPALLGQSLFGPTNYIVPPEDINSIF